MESSKYCDSARTETTAPPSSGFFDNETGAEPKDGSPEKKMRIDPQE
jgi:hypothetical protein